MHGKLADGDFALAMGGGDCTTSLKLFEGDVTRAIVLLRHGMKVIDEALFLALAEKELWRFLEPDDCDAEDAEDQDQGRAGIHDVAGNMISERHNLQEIDVNYRQPMLISFVHPSAEKHVYDGFAGKICFSRKQLDVSS